MAAQLLFIFFIFMPSILAESCPIPNTCLYCSPSSPVNCSVSQPDPYSYKYVCEAPSHCTPRAVSQATYGRYCLGSLSITNENTVSFMARDLSYQTFNSCVDIRSDPLMRNCSNINLQVSSFEKPHTVWCFCNEDDCQRLMVVTLFIDQPDSASSSVPIMPSSSSIISISSAAASLSSSFGFTTMLTQSSSSSAAIQSVTTRSVPPTTTTDGSSMKEIGLISGITILTLILAIITVIILFVLFCSFRKQTSKSRHSSHQLEFNVVTAPVSEPAEELPPLPFQFLQTIGQGKFGSVWKALYSNQTVAVRVFSHRHRTSWQNERDIYLLESTHHKNVLKFIYSDSRGRSYNAEYFIVTEYHPLGSLYQFLRHNTLSWEQAWNIMYTVTSGIAHLHSTNYYNSDGFIAEKYSIAHRDIKPSNILVKDASGQCVVADLGLAFILDPAADDRKLAVSGQVGTYRYMAPEALDARVNLRDIESFKQIDVYALTLVLWEVCSRYKMDDGPLPMYQPPFFDLFGEKPTLEQMREVVVTNKQRPPILDEWNNKNLMPIISLIKDGWDEDPEARLTAANIIVQLENVVGMKVKVPPLSSVQPEGKFLSPVSEETSQTSRSSCKKYRLSSSFSSSTSTITPPPPFNLPGRFSVDYANINNTVLSLRELQRFREEMAPANSVDDNNVISTINSSPPPPSPPPDASCTIATPSAEASSTSDQQDKVVNIIDVTTGQPQ